MNRRVLVAALVLAGVAGIYWLRYRPAAAEAAAWTERLHRVERTLAEREAGRREAEAVRLYVAGDGLERGSWLDASEEAAMAGILGQIREAGLELLFLRADGSESAPPLDRDAFALGVRGSWPDLLGLLRYLERGSPLSAVDLLHVVSSPTSEDVTLRLRIAVFTPSTGT